MVRDISAAEYAHQTLVSKAIFKVIVLIGDRGLRRIDSEARQCKVIVKMRDLHDINTLRLLDLQSTNVVVFNRFSHIMAPQFS